MVPVLPPAFSLLPLPPPPSPLTCASSRAYRCSLLIAVFEPGVASSRMSISTVSRAGSVM